MEYALGGSWIGSVRGIVQRLGPERGASYLARLEAEDDLGTRGETELVLAMIELAEEEEPDAAVDLYQPPDLLETLRERAGRRNSALIEVAEAVVYAWEQLALRGHGAQVTRCVLDEGDASVEMHIALASNALQAEIEQGDAIRGGVQVSLRATDDQLDVDLLPRFDSATTNDTMPRSDLG